jgi:hypothetical protein
VLDLEPGTSSMKKALSAPSRNPERAGARASVSTQARSAAAYLLAPLRVSAGDGDFRRLVPLIEHCARHG